MSNVKVLILDEPTASLADTETRLLHSILRTIRDSGTACIYISHKIEEVMEIADYVTVFRDGKTIGGNEIGAITQPEIIRMMVGRELTEYYPNNGHVPDHSQTVLEIKNFNVREPKTEKQMVEDVSFKLYKGEILAVTGLVGAGRTELMTAVYGATSWLSGGELFINGEKKVIDSPETALKNGIAFVTEDRKDYGIISNLSVRSNTSISTLAQFGSIKSIDSDKEAASVNELVDSLHIKTPSIDTMIVNLSGGNQQKVLLARSLLNDVKVLILDEPTRGIDVGAKYEIYTIMNALVDKGISVVMVSSEMPEVLGMADRVIVMCKGRVTGEFDNTKKNTLSQEQILTCAIGAKVQ